MNVRFLAYLLAILVSVSVLTFTAAAAIDYYVFEKDLPCRKPMQYSIGFIDPRFGVSKETVAQELAAAAKIWSDVLKRPLFVEAQKGGVRVHYVFDKRQELTLKKLSLEKSIAYIMAQTIKLDTEDKALQAAKLALKVRETELIASGNLSYAAFEEMKRVNRQLKARSEQFEKDTVAFNLFVDTYNSDAKAVEKQMPKGSIVRGEYLDDKRGNTSIKIYMFTNQTVMREILAHEFGHALSLDHIPDEKAIMHKNTDGILTPSAADIAALRNACELDFWTYFTNKWKK